MRHDNRRFLPRPPHFSPGISPPPSQNDIPIPYLPSKQYFPSPQPQTPTNPHPLVYPTGDVCISILHAPTADPYGYESASERWSPVQTPETILLSVISMLSSPNDESPANVEAARMWREDLKEFRRRCRRDVRRSLGEE